MLCEQQAPHHCWPGRGLRADFARNPAPGLIPVQRFRPAVQWPLQPACWGKGRARNTGRQQACARGLWHCPWCLPLLLLRCAPHLRSPLLLEGPGKEWVGRVGCPHPCVPDPTTAVHPTPTTFLLASLPSPLIPGPPHLWTPALRH